MIVTQRPTKWLLTHQRQSSRSTAAFVNRGFNLGVRQRTKPFTAGHSFSQRTEPLYCPTDAFQRWATLRDKPCYRLIVSSNHDLLPCRHRSRMAPKLVLAWNELTVTIN
jgi:hypothetical protein